jgi:hypothetical protein
MYLMINTGRRWRNFYSEKTVPRAVEPEGWRVATGVISNGSNGH